jgi:hypothetical protein
MLSVNRRKFLYFVLGSLSSVAVLSKVSTFFIDQIIKSKNSVIKFVPIDFAETITFIYVFNPKDYALIEEILKKIQDPRAELIKDWVSTNKISQQKALFHDRFFSSLNFRSSQDLKLFLDEFNKTNSNVGQVCRDLGISCKIVIS